VPPDHERLAAFKAVKDMITNLVPAMFRSYVTDQKVWDVSDAALWAAEEARIKFEMSSKIEPQGPGSAP
jgi:hypothetical protein